ncbi:SDR family oxidoreductase [Allosaccharopolyspora coralli]|uniref:SDR family oxidoreductase n=1 Tax=Allosaccharopolyspora coralli TaxID=2665642 RepID=A0A5Q3QIQ5_9PSEU|nr:SDR family oxidoreductase [Allosaccharopolyspora coralli]QGK70727.1 SDR family oxidoreductase [Allosaccharopolyspora coralli]
MTTPTAPEPRNTQPLSGQGALITGGSRGIGRAIAARLAADGAVVVITYATDHASAETLVAEITAQGGRARAVQLDLAVPEQFDRVFTTADQAFRDAGVDGLSVLVANAGIMAQAPIDELSVDEWDRIMATNARGAFLTVQHGARRLRDHGRIITMSTIGTAWPSAGEAAYAASKAAIEQITRVASRELGHRGITANTVSLGPTETDLLRAGAPPEALDGAAAMTALGRIGRPSDVADLVALLVHPDNGWMTGQNIHADGGLT